MWAILGMNKTRNDRQLRTVIAVVITVAWSVSFVADIVLDDYNPPGSVGALMLMVAGALFGEGVIRGVKNGSVEENGR